MGNGPLDQLLEHLPSIKDQIAKGSLDYFKVELSNTIYHTWVTKATLMRFLHILGSSHLKKAMAICNEMAGLEEARKFHLSLYTHVEKGITTSDTSKNVLLRAMDSRITALTEELSSAINLSAGANITFQDMIDLKNCCQNFGAMKIRYDFVLNQHQQHQQGLYQHIKRNEKHAWLKRACKNPLMGYNLSFWHHLKFEVPSALIVYTVGLILIKG